jgi:hypothetical protein
MARGGAVAASAWKGCGGGGPGMSRHARTARGWMLRAKALAGVLADGITAASLDVVFPVGSVILELQPYCRGFTW